MMSNPLLIIFARNPELGRVKSRLAQTAGPVKALEIYNLLLNRTCQIALDSRSDKTVYYSDRLEQDDIWDSQVFKKAVQSNGDLGVRMLEAFRRAFDDGYDKVVIIGSDCYELTSEIINTAFEELNQTDMVIGPAKDGGYYLIGMKELHSQVFIDKKWSTPSVLKDTLHDIGKLGLKLRLLPLLNDVDFEEDLKGLQLEMIKTR